MKYTDRKYLLKEAQRTLDQSDSTAAYCLCQRWILKDTIALLKELQAVEMDKKNNFIKCSECEWQVDCPVMWSYLNAACITIQKKKKNITENDRR